MLKGKRIARSVLIFALILALSATFCFADGEAAKEATNPGVAENMMQVVAPITDLIEEFLAPLLLVVGSVGTLYCVLLGVKYARAEEPQDREKAKAHLKGAIIGFVLIFVLIVLLKFLLPYLTNWVNNVELGK